MGKLAVDRDALRLLALVGRSWPRVRALALGAGVVTYLAAPWPPVALAGLALALVLALADPWPAVVLLPLAAPFFAQPKAVDWLPLSPPEFIALLVIAGGGARLVCAGRRLATWRPSAWDLAALLFVGGAALATATALDRSLAARELRTVVVEPVLCGYVAWYCLRRPLRRVGLVAALLLSGGVVAALAVLRVWQGDVVMAQGVLRLTGPYGSPNHLALYLDRVVPLAAAVAWLGPRSARGWALAALAALVLVALLTWSLGGWLALWVGTLALVAAAGRRRLVAGWLALSLGLAVVAASLLVFGGDLVPERLRARFDPETGTGLVRVGVWQAGLRMALAHPVTGVGPDNFRLLYAEYGENVWREPDLSHPHNFILDTWLRAGLAGLAGYLALLGLALSAAWRRARRAAGWDRALGAGVLAALAAGVAHGLVDREYFAVDLAFVFWLLWALIRGDSS